MDAPVLSEAGTAVCIICIFLVPLAAAGLSLINTGLGRSRSAAHCMATSLSVTAVATLVYLICGFAWQGYAGRPAHVINVAGSWNWIAAEPFFFRGLKFDGSAASLAVFLHMFSVGLAALIPLGSGADRWRLGASCASTALLAGWTYPLFGHWAWGGGWLAQLGINFGLGRGFVDAGGAGPIHVVGGLTALSVAWLLGPRGGKYGPDGAPNAIPGHNTVLVLFGCMLALVGWMGLNSAGAMLFAGSQVSGAALIAINTILSAGSAALITLLVTRMRFGKPDASLVANGWVGGLVACSAGCAFIRPAAAVVIGGIAGAIVPLTIELLDVRLAVDDPSGAVSVHAIAGIWGLLAVSVFGRLPQQQWLAQLAGVATLLGFVLPLTYGLNWVLNRLIPFRVAAEGESQGMDVHELGGGAYPEFVTHTEEFIQR